MTMDENHPQYWIERLRAHGADSRYTTIHKWDPLECVISILKRTVSNQCEFWQALLKILGSGDRVDVFEARIRDLPIGLHNEQIREICGDEFSLDIEHTNQVMEVIHDCHGSGKGRRRIITSAGLQRDLVLLNNVLGQLRKACKHKFRYDEDKRKFLSKGKVIAVSDFICICILSLRTSFSVADRSTTELQIHRFLELQSWPNDQAPGYCQRTSQQFLDGAVWRVHENADINFNPLLLKETTNFRYVSPSVPLYVLVYDFFQQFFGESMDEICSESNVKFGSAEMIKAYVELTNSGLYGVLKATISSYSRENLFHGDSGSPDIPGKSYSPAGPNPFASSNTYHNASDEILDRGEIVSTISSRYGSAQPSITGSARSTQTDQSHELQETHPNLLSQMPIGKSIEYWYLEGHGKTSRSSGRSGKKLKA